MGISSQDEFKIVSNQIAIVDLYIISISNRYIYIYLYIYTSRSTSISYIYLVGGLEHFLFFHILGIIIPID